ncbi:MAG: LacI family transcriptional regulator [Spirochaetaceae bacterium]|jgi:DNA-binding LacI/PurR family transcriptional regulator|nr:LacI family transcriptional regulator [Spirochaetaceae bacterium]
MIRMKDVAKHAGVSVATVSNVITGKHLVSELIRMRVLNSMRELNYNINLVARGLKTQRTNTIGVILPDVTKLFFLDVLKGIMETAVAENYNINIYSSNFNFETERALVNALHSSRVDGIILDTCVDRKRGAEWARDLSIAGIYSPPVVSIECRMDAGRVSAVVVDSNYWSSRITQHLIDTGRRRIFFITGLAHIEHEYDRLEGYKETLKKNGLPVLEELIAGGNFLSGMAYDTICRALERGIHFDAIQASNDQAAIGAIKALSEHDIAVPEDVAVCGFDDLFPSTLITPAITTISIPRYEMGVTAMREVLRRIRDKNASPSQYVLNAEFIVRASSCADIKTTWNLENW